MMPFQVFFVLNNFSSITHKLSPSCLSFNPVKNSGAVDPALNPTTLQPAGLEILPSHDSSGC